MDREALESFRSRALNPEHPVLRNTVQNGDVYFQLREASNPILQCSSRHRGRLHGAR